MGSTSSNSSGNGYEWVLLIGLLFSITICPLAAFFLRHSVFAVTENNSTRFVIFLLIGSLQIVLIFFTYYGFNGYEYFRDEPQKMETRTKYEHYKELTEKLDNADIDITVTKAEILQDDGKNVSAEITLRIKNVPLIIPYYEMNIHQIETDDLFLPLFTNNSILKVFNEDGKWVFRNFHSNQIISTDENEVNIPLEFIRKNASQKMLPKTITPRLGIWAREDKVYFGTHNFFYKPTPVNFKMEAQN